MADPNNRPNNNSAVGVILISLAIISLLMLALFGLKFFFFD
jgi:hypothetical protein